MAMENQAIPPSHKLYYYQYQKLQLPLPKYPIFIHKYVSKVLLELQLYKGRELPNIQPYLESYMIY